MTRHQRRTAATACPGRFVVVATLVAAPVLAQSDEERWPHLEELQVHLAQPEQLQSIEALAVLGADAAPAAWAVLSGQAPADSELDRSATRARLQPAILRWSGADTAATLLAALSPETTLAQRLVALELLGWTDHDAALSASLDVLAGCDPLLLRSQSVAPALRASLRGLLADDPGRYRVLAQALESRPTMLLQPVLTAVAQFDAPEAAELILRIAELDSSLELDVLREVGRRGQPLAPGARQAAFGLVRRGLGSRDPRLRRLAAVAVGELRDTASFERLVDLLSDSDAVVQRVALQALHTLTGLRRHWGADAWLRWLDGELEWFDAEQRIADDLDSGDAYRIGRALRDATTHRFLAHELVDILADGLMSFDAEVRTRVCAALAQLGHTAAVPDLILRIDDSNEEVRRAARRALVSLGAPDQGSRAAAWDRWWQDIR